MRYQTHLVTTNCIGLPILFMTNQFNLLPVIAMNVGAVFPDIDHPRSYIGNRSGGVSKLINKLFGHRGMMHSLFSIVVVSFIFSLIAASFEFETGWIRWFALGYLLHLIEDGFSKNGVAFFAPVISSRLQLGFNIIYYTTGKITEKIIFWLALIGLVFLLLQYHTDGSVLVEVNRFYNQL